MKISVTRVLINFPVNIIFFSSRCLFLDVFLINVTHSQRSSSTLHEKPLEKFNLLLPKGHLRSEKKAANLLLSLIANLLITYFLRMFVISTLPNTVSHLLILSHSMF